MKISLVIFTLCSALFQLFGQGEVLFVPDYKPFGIPAEHGIASYDMHDFNGDGDLDVIASIVDNGSSKIVLALGPDLTELISTPDYLFSLSPKTVPFYITLSDIDNDGDMDLYLGEHAEYQIDASVFILENQSVGSSLNFQLRTDLPIDQSYIVAIPSAIDYDNDDLEDLFLSDFDGNITVFKNLGAYNYVKIGTNVFGLSGFDTQCACDELSNGANLICYDKENDFNLFLYNGSNYKKDTVTSIFANPDRFEALFFQPRIRDLDDDGITDAFLSVNTFSLNSGFYSDSWLYNGFCVDTLFKPEVPIVSETYTARDVLVSTGEIRSPSGVVYKSGESIVLDTTFTIKLGGIFEAIIEECED